MTEYKTVEGHEIQEGVRYECRDGEPVLVQAMGTDQMVVTDSLGEAWSYGKDGKILGKTDEGADIMRPWTPREEKEKILPEVFFNQAVHEFMTKIDTETSSPTFSAEITEAVAAINIRDDFAIAGLPMVRDLMLSIIARDRAAGFPDPSEMAKLAYQFADAMLEARKEKKDE